MVFTDPPYNIGYDYWGFRGTRKHGVKSKKMFSDKKDDTQFYDFIYNVFSNCFLYSKGDSTFYCWHSSKMANLFSAGIEDAGYHISQCLMWLKSSLVFSPGQDYHRIYEPCLFGWKRDQKRFVHKSYNNLTELINLEKMTFEEMLDVWYVRRDVTKEYKHPTQKPVRLAEFAIKHHSSVNDILIEPFGGSGSTLMACQQLNRKCYTIELDPKFCDVIVNRWEKFTGLKSKRL